MKKCQFIKPDKTKCGGFAVKGDKYCFFHSQKYKKLRRKAIIKGGKSLKRNYGRIDNIIIACSSDILRLLEQTINDLRQGKTSVRIANAIGYLSGIAFRAIEQYDLSKRLEIIEYALKIRKKDY
jgi:hypothetical protein